MAFLLIRSHHSLPLEEIIDWGNSHDFIIQSVTMVYIQQLFDYEVPNLRVPRIPEKQPN